MISIVRNNNTTFHDHRRSRPVRIWPRQLLSAGIAGICTFLFAHDFGEFLSAVITVLSILVGFSFSVLFFLLSGSEVEADNSGSIERDLKEKQLTKLSEELFYNVSFFNLVTVVCVVISLLLLLPSPSINWAVLFLTQNTWTYEWMPSWTADAARLVIRALRYALCFAFYLALIESIYTFFRTVGRVSYYFEEKLKFQRSSKLPNSNEQVASKIAV